jgi:hypothetical protein
MTTLREAAKQALEALGVAQDHWHTYHGGLQSGKINEAIAALRAALEQPEQEPVACIRTWHKKNGDQHAELWDWCDGIGSLPEGEHLLFTHPPRREWRSLSEEEIKAIHLELCKTVGSYYRTVARAIEAALKERNA